MNQLEKVAPQILAQGLMALRNMNSMPALVNSDYNMDLRNRGETVDIPIPSSVAVQDVVPGATSGTTKDITPDSVSVKLSEWKEAPFYLTDRDIAKAMNGIIPLQASEAVASLADYINAFLLGKYTKVYGVHKVTGGLFATDTSAASQARKILNIQKCPQQERRFVMDPDAEANALNLRAFQDMNFGVTAAQIAEGKMAPKLGFLWAMDQQVPIHTCEATSSGANITVKTAVVSSPTAVEGVAGHSQITLQAVDTGVVVGDILEIAGDAQTYAVVSAGGVSSNEQVVEVIPQLPKVPSAGTVVTPLASHTVNLAFHRDAFAFVSRPLADTTQGLGSIIETMTDPVSKITLRLEITREHKRTRFSYDILFGGECVRPQLATRVAALGH